MAESLDILIFSGFQFFSIFFTFFLDFSILSISSNFPLPIRLHILPSLHIRNLRPRRLRVRTATGDRLPFFFFGIFLSIFFLGIFFIFLEPKSVQQRFSFANFPWRAD